MWNSIEKYGKALAAFWQIETLNTDTHTCTNAEKNLVLLKENTCFKSKRFSFCRCKWVNHFVVVVVASGASKDAAISFSILIHAWKWLFFILISISNEFNLNASQPKVATKAKKFSKNQNLAARQLRWCCKLFILHSRK